jgi:integrase
MHLEWLAESGKSSDTIRNYRGYLERVADALGAATAAHAVSIPGRTVAAPYPPKREAMLEAWARAQPTALGRDRALALLGLAAGSGLSNAEILGVTKRHVVDAASTLWVRVAGGRDRLIPVRERWSPHLRARVANTATWDDAVFPMGDATAEDTVEKWLGRSHAGARPVAGRLRSTWIVSNLRDGVKPEQLFEWSGVGRGETLVPYLAFVPEVATEDLRRALMHLRTPSSGVI